MGSRLTISIFGIVAIFVAALAMLTLASPAYAESGGAARITADCRTSAGEGTNRAGSFAGWQGWTCQGPKAQSKATEQVLRFDLDRLASADVPRFLVSRTARFDRVVVGVVDRQGNIAESVFDFETISATFFNRQFALRLPEIGSGSQALLVRFEGLAQPIPVDYAHIRSTEPGSTDAERNALLLIALLCGVMLTPLIFDAAFYRVLREPFIIWHAAFVMCVVWQMAATFGLHLTFADLSLPATRLNQVGSFTAMVLTGAIFCAKFLEDGKVDPRIKRALIGGAPLFLVVGVIHVAGIQALGGWPSLLYYYSGGLYGAIAIAALVQAIARGSIAARYLALGLGPLIFVALLRVVTFAIPGVPTADANEFLIVATLIEAIATAMGVTHRFMAIRDERDRTRSENRALERLANLDPLTGLMNRRALMASFDRLVDEGYHTCALLDVDRFKSINDEFGHGVGDDVLVEVARALQPDEHTAAFRLGGEEFLVLLRGPGAVERAERRRQAVAARVLTGVPGLDRPVTASMGVVDFSALASEAPIDFASIYSRADQLLYGAKGLGRNRTEVEMLTFFEAEDAPLERQRA